ncbi:MAG TPA: urea transporter [Phycisphaerae bacterium]|nr:urea transporter [Phycisphaerales bacterium]HRX84913.1 urea transporter [Phycisphaerae bacterium]
MHDAILSPWIGWMLLAVFSVLWITLGWYWGHKARRSLDDYMLAGRNVGLALGTATAMATWVTSNTTMAAPQLAYQMGIWGMIGYSLGSMGLILFAPMAERIKALIPRGYTSGDFVRLRYGKAAWRVFLAISIFYGLGWLISMGMAGGLLLNALTGIRYEVGLTVILIVCMAYTMMGGLYAVIGTDFIQSILILAGIVLLAIIAYERVGFEPVHAALAAKRPDLLNLLMPAALMFLFNNLIFGLGEIFHSNVWWSRAFAFRKGVGLRAYLLAGIFWAPVPIVAGAVALVAPHLGMNVPAADMVGPLVAARLLGAAGAVVIFIVVFSSLASSLDSLLAATSDLIVEDIYRKHFRPEAEESSLRRASFLTIVLLTVAAWLICLPRVTHLAGMIAFTGAFVGSAIWPIAAGLYWRKTNPLGATLGMVAGSACGLFAYFYVGWYVAALIGAAVSMVIVLATTLAAPRDFDWQRLQEHTDEEPAVERAPAWVPETVANA